MLRLTPGHVGAAEAWPRGVELFVVEGDLVIDGTTYRAGAWLRLPPGGGGARRRGGGGGSPRAHWRTGAEPSHRGRRLRPRPRLGLARHPAAHHRGRAGGGAALTEQAEAGSFVYQDQTGRIQRLLHGFAQEPPSMRISGGVAALVEAVAVGLAPGVVRLEHAVRRIALTGSGIAVTAESASGPVTLHAARAALALPPRLIGGIEILPALPAPVQTELAAVPGWMAGQAKALALYDRPFWREAGRSGSAFSQAGPLGELHDASLPGAAEAALFGFFYWPPALRAARRAALPELVARQLGLLFGAEAARPREVIIQDWATAPFTATEADHANGSAHPEYRPVALPAPWGERITLAGAEAAPEFGGYLEGALAAAEMAATA